MQKQISPSQLLPILAPIMASVALVEGLAILSGWVFSLEWLKNPFPDEPPVAVSTALCLILSAVAVLLKRVGRSGLSKIFSLVSMSIALAIFFHYLIGSFDLDALFNGSSLAPLGPNRMAPSVLFCFCCINIATVLDHKRFQSAIDFCVLFANVLCLTAFIAHYFDVPKLLRISTLIQMSSPAALAGILLAWSVLFLEPSKGFVSVLDSDGLGGRFARQYLLPTIVLPLLIGRITLQGELFGWYNSNLGTAIVVLIVICSLTSMIWRVSIWLDEADKQRDLAQEDMRSSIAGTRLIVETAMDAFLSLDKEGQIVDWNHAAEQMFGWSREEAIGKKFDFVIAPSAPEFHLGDFVRLSETGESENLNRRIEITLIRKDGTEFFAEGSPFIVKFQGLERICAFMHDISGRKENERRINEFISTVSHELRTPLTSIKGALRLIEGGVAGEIPEEALSLVNVATSETERLVRLVNDILDLKKIEAGKLELKFERVDMQTLVSDSLEGIAGMASEFGIVLHKEVLSSAFSKCDKDRIIQVLQNLLSNAIKFSPEGETVTLRLELLPSHMVRFSVRDKGCGIPESQIHKLFGRFQQLDSSDSRQQGGTGLGLAISKAIVEQHDGKIGYETRYREGSNFWFDIPALLEFEP